MWNEKIRSYEWKRRYYKNNEPQTTFFKNNIKNTLRTFEAQNGENFKNIEPRSKITGSYKKKRLYAKFLEIYIFVRVELSNVHTHEKF